MNPKTKFQEAVDRATVWIVTHQQPDGSFGEVESLTHYMALPAALLYLGRAESASRLMPYLKSTYLKDNGDYDFPPANAKPGHLAEAKYGPTLHGYTPDTAESGESGPNWRLVEEMCSQLSVPVITEGGIRTPDQARRALDLGVFAVVVGTAITRPRVISAAFVEAMNRTRHQSI